MNGRLLLQPTSFLPAFEAALTQLVQGLHDPLKHKISGNECELAPLFRLAKQLTS